MSEVSQERGFSAREIEAAVTFVVLTGVIAFTSFHNGMGMSSGVAAGEMMAAVAVSARRCWKLPRGRPPS